MEIATPILRDIYAQDGAPHWRRGGLVMGPNGGVFLLWDGKREERMYREGWAYAEYEGKPFFVAMDDDGLLVRYGDTHYPAGEELYGPPGIIAGKVFYMSRFSDGWELAWNGFGQPIVGGRLHMVSLDIRPHSDGSGFDAAYQADVTGGVIAVFNSQRSRVFEYISLQAMFRGGLLVCGSHGGRWYLDYAGVNLAAENWMFDIQFDEAQGRVSYRTSLSSQRRTEVNVTA